MRVGELSRRSGVSVASIKYYLREGLLPAGERTGPNQAVYDDTHVHRLRLVRALIDVGGLTVAGTREVLAAVDDGENDLFCALGAAHSSTARTAGEGEDDDEAVAGATALLDDLLARRNWRVSPRNPSRRTAIEALATLHRLGGADLTTQLDLYAETMERVARREVAVVLARGEREQVVEGVVVGTVVGDTLIGALRRMAHEHWSGATLDPDDERSALDDD